MAAFPKPYADAVARLRVPSGFLIVLVFAWFSHPTAPSLELGLPVSVAGALMPDAHVGYGLPIGGATWLFRTAVRSNTGAAFAGNAGAVQRTPFEQQRTAVAGGARPGSFETNRGSTPTNYTSSGRGSSMVRSSTTKA